LFEDVSYSMIKYDADKYNSPLKLEWTIFKWLNEVESVERMCLSQVCHYLMAGQVKSVKPCLKQLQQSIQTIMQPTWPSDESELFIQCVVYLLRKLSCIWPHFIYFALIPITYFLKHWIPLSALRPTRNDITQFSLTLCLYLGVEYIHQFKKFPTFI
jgi:hypothetical protein